MIAKYMEGSHALELEPETDDDAAMLVVVQECLMLYSQRNVARNGVWRRSGLRGQLFHLYAKSERAFRQMFQGEVSEVDPDHLRDAVIYGLFALILHSSGDKNGEWPWA